jgi:rubrerythrin
MSREQYEKIYEQYKKIIVKEHGDMGSYQCKGCGWMYHPRSNDDTPFSRWPGPCPNCGAEKDQFKRMVNISEMLSQLPVDFKDATPEQKDLQILRAGMIAELDAVNFYEQMAQQTKNEKVKKVLLDVAYEEKVHAEEFEQVLEELDPEYEKADDQAEKEGEEMKEGINLKHLMKELKESLKNVKK